MAEVVEMFLDPAGGRLVGLLDGPCHAGHGIEITAAPRSRPGRVEAPRLGDANYVYRVYLVYLVYLVFLLNTGKSVDQED